MTTAAAPSPPSSSPPPSPSPPSTTGRIIASPIAKKLAQELGIDLRTVPLTGTGPNQRIIKQDVLEYAQQRATQPAVAVRVSTAPPPTAQFTDIPVSQIRKVCFSFPLFRSPPSLSSFLSPHIASLHSVVKKSPET
jgi:pyruvate dehydrogenase E2 component (dihydrolipoamide acetyltransferase)